jgi:putative lipoprotein
MADCNRFTGPYSSPADGVLEMAAVAGTLMACLPPSSGTDFTRTLGAITRYVISGARLTLTTADGRGLVFESADTSAGGPPRPGTTFVFACPNAAGGPFSFTARVGPGETAIWLPARFDNRYVVLEQIPAASGARYEGDGVGFWNRGQEATLRVGDESFEACVSEPHRAVWEDARLSGIDFRGVGQEPGWLLEIRDGEAIRFVHSYGEREVNVPAPTATREASATVYRASTEAHEITITLVNEACSDAMSGEAFDTSVSIELDGEAYAGCGRYLR